MTPPNRRHATETAQPMQEPAPEFPAQHQSPPGLERDIEPHPRWRGARYRDAGTLEGQVALITGGDSGIGRAVAYHFAREGADVAIVCMPGESPDAREVEQAVTALGRRCLVLEGNLANSLFCNDVVEQAAGQLGRLDILVHNAAGQNRKRVEGISEEELDRTLTTNVYAYLRLARAAVPRMHPGSCIIAT